MAWLLVALAGGYLALWTLGVISSGPLRQGRFLITPLLLLCPVVAWAIQQLGTLATPNFEPRRLALLFVAVWAVLALLAQGLELLQRDPLRGLLAGPESRAAWQAGQIGNYPYLAEALHALPEGSRALLLMEPRSYGSPAPTEADTLLYEWPWRLHRAGDDPARVTADLCAEGLTHAAIWWRGARHMRDEAGNHTPLSAEQFRRLEEWRDGQSLLWERWSGDALDYQLLELSCPAPR